MSLKRLGAALIPAYAVTVIALWVVVEGLTDRAWPATVIAFAPRWPVAVPLLGLMALGVLTGFDRRSAVLLLVTTLVLLLGLLDFRLGLGRTAEAASLRVMTQNVGASQVNAASLDRLMRNERIDVAALQECPFYDHSVKRYGWHFFYGGDLCLVSRFPFSVLDVPDAEEVWRRNERVHRFEVHGPGGRFEIVNVHLSTVRDGLDALRLHVLGGLPLLEANRRESARQSRDARERTNRTGAPFIVAGDFNLPVESTIYRQTWGDLANTFSSCGRGFGYTKFTRLHGVRIDHVLTSADWRCTTAYVLASPYGGDHAPLVVELALQPSQTSRTLQLH